MPPAGLRIAQGTRCRVTRWIAHCAMDSLLELRPFCASRNEKGLAFVDFAHGVPRGARSFAYPRALRSRTLAVLRTSTGGGEAGASRARCGAQAALGVSRSRVPLPRAANRGRDARLVRPSPAARLDGGLSRCGLCRVAGRRQPRDPKIGRRPSPPPTRGGRRQRANRVRRPVRPPRCAPTGVSSRGGPRGAGVLCRCGGNGEGRGHCASRPP